MESPTEKEVCLLGIHEKATSMVLWSCVVIGLSGLYAPVNAAPDPASTGQEQPAASAEEPGSSGKQPEGRAGGRPGQEGVPMT